MNASPRTASASPYALRPISPCSQVCFKFFRVLPWLFEKQSPKFSVCFCFLSLAFSVFFFFFVPILGWIADDEVPKGFPKFTVQPHMQGVERGRSALIPCKAEGDPEPTISWLKDMVPIDMSNSRYSFYQGGECSIDRTGPSTRRLTFL